MLPLFRNRSIVFHLAELALVAVIPFLVLTAYNIYDRTQADTRTATAAVSRIAESTANETGRIIQLAGKLLGLLAGRPQVRALDQKRCDPLLTEIFHSFPLAANVGTLDVSGRLVCSAVPLDFGKSVDPAYFLTRTIQSRQFTVGSPTVGIVTQKWVVVLAMPILDDDGEVKGVVAIAVDLVKFSRALNARSTPAPSITAIVDANGKFIARSADPEQWVGKQAPALTADDYWFVDGRGTASVDGVDGVKRIYASEEIPGTGWSAVAGIPVSRVFAAAALNAEISTVLALAISMLVSLLCFRLARRISNPIEASAEGARRAGAGDRNVHIEPEGPAEIARVSTEFNDMLASRLSAENALRKSERRLRVALDRFETIFLGAPEAMSISEIDTGRLVQVNDAFCNLFGYARAELIGRTSLELGLWNVPSRRHDVLESLHAGQSVREREGQARRPTGELRDILYSGDAVQFGDERRLLLMFRDITERKQSEEARVKYTGHLRRLLRRLMELEEQERRRLRRELHDRTGSNLSALLLSLGVLRGSLSPELTRQLEPRISDFEVLLRETMEHVSDVLVDLHPPALDDLGLLAALSQHGRLVASRAGTIVSVEGTEPSPRLSKDIEISLFRIAQEALNNATKHAQASEIRVSLTEDVEQVTLIVEDDGRGFDPIIQQQGAPGLGMVTMRERAEAIGALLTIDARPGAGTLITVTLGIPTGG